MGKGSTMDYHRGGDETGSKGRDYTNGCTNSRADTARCACIEMHHQNIFHLFSLSVEAFGQRTPGVLDGTDKHGDGICGRFLARFITAGMQTSFTQITRVHDRPDSVMLPSGAEDVAIIDKPSGIITPSLQPVAVKQEHRYQSALVQMLRGAKPMPPPPLDVHSD
eukprot:445369-Amphidinium_carterae.3